MSGQTGSSSKGGVTVKTEKRALEPAAEDTGEFDDWAKKLVSRPIPQMVTGTPQAIPSNSVSQFLLQNSTTGNNGMSTSVTVGQDGLPPHKGFDRDSAIGRFTWHTVEEDKYIPCLFRSGQKYCCVRMIEVSILGDYLTILPQDIYDAAKLSSHIVTAAEAKLLTYINNWHCDGFYGAEPFTLADLVVSLEEMEQFHSYLVFAYHVLQSGGRNKDDDFSNCGFVRVNGDNLIPYTVLPEDEKGVPLFYFEGQIDILKEKATPLTGWELAYLKICCKVQGVRKDLIAGETLQIVKLTDLKGYFPKRASFEENCWPPPKQKSLLPKQPALPMGYSFGAQSVASQNAVPHTRWTRQLTNDTFNQSNSNSNNLSTRTFVNVSTNGGGLNLGNLSTGMSLTNAAGRQYNLVQPGSLTAIGNSASSQFFGIRNGLAPMAGQTPMLNNPVPPAALPQQIISSNGQIVQLPRNQTMAKSPNLSKIRAMGPPVELSKLNPIPEYAEGGREGAYVVRMIIIDKEYMHCINHKPFKAEGYLIVLQEFVMKFFPTVSLYPTCVSVLKNLGIPTYLPNTAQMGTFNRFGFAIQRLWEIPLISATDAAQQISRIRTLLTPKPTAIRPRHNAIQETQSNNSGSRTARVLPNGYNTSSSYYSAR